MSSVFLLQHVAQQDGVEDAKILGIYSSEVEAKNAIARFTLLPGFKDHPDGFSIDKYSMNKDSWVTGFTNLTQVFVPLLDEGIEVWRPVWATHIEGDLYRIESRNADPTDESWKFKTGQLVRCEPKDFDDGRGLVAVEAADDLA